MPKFSDKYIVFEKIRLDLNWIRVESAIKKLQEVLNSIPEYARHEATLILEHDNSGGKAQYVEYRREMTEEEKAAKDREEADWQLKLEAAERREFERLKNKFWDQ
jgi:ParB-like chromosome segregation protein Spo0J